MDDEMDDELVIAARNGVSFYIDVLKYYKIDDLYVTKTFVINYVICQLYSLRPPMYNHAINQIYNETHLICARKSYPFDITKMDYYSGELVIYLTESTTVLTKLYCNHNLIDGTRLQKTILRIYNSDYDKFEYINGRKHGIGYKNGIKID